MSTRTFRPRPTRIELVGRSGAHVILWRWITGQRLNGRPLTNATFLHAGDTALDRTKIKVARRHYRPRWQRAAARNGSVLVTLCLIVALVVSPAALLTTLGVIAAAVALPAGVAIREVAKNHQHRKTYRVPLARWYASTYQVPLHDALQRIEIPLDHTDNPDAVSVIQMPDDYVPRGTQGAGDAAAVAAKLGLADPDWSLETLGVPRLTISAAPSPPSVVTFQDMLPYLDTPDDETLFVGFGRRGTPVYLSWGLDSPHALLSFESGMGKTNFNAAVSLQTIHKGGEVDIFDFAKHGASVADWCRDENGIMLPGIRVHLTVEDAHARLIELAEERMARSKAIWERTKNRSDFTRHLIVMEESNISMPMLVNYWKKIKESGDPFVSPAVEAYRSIPGAGREVKFNLLVICQKGSARAAGGEEIRENTGIKCFGNSSVRTLKNLIEHIKPLPAMYNTPGRIALCVGSTATDVQVGQWIDSKDPRVAAAGRAWAVTGTPQLEEDRPLETVLPPEVESPVVPAPDSLNQEVTGSVTAAEGTPEQTTGGSDVDLDGLLSVAEALDQGVITGTPASVKMSRSRNPEGFPQHRSKRGQTYLYARADLMAWELLKGLNSGTSVRDDKKKEGDK